MAGEDSQQLERLRSEHENTLTALENALVHVDQLTHENAHLEGRVRQLERQLRQTEAALAAKHDQAGDRTAGDGRQAPLDRQRAAEAVTLIEELQVTTEELQATNEELQVQGDKLAHANAALKEANDQLETRVAERTAELSTALAERDALLRTKDLLAREIHHRVANSLQMVNALLSMQSKRAPDPGTRELLGEAVGRVQAIAKVHYLLHRTSRAEIVGSRQFFREVCDDLARSAGTDENRQLRLRADEDILPADMALSLGLITNELITNAFKHAFPPEEPGVVSVDFRKDVTGGWTLVVADNGRGVTEDCKPKAASGLGMQVIDALVRKLNATLAVEQQDGCRFTLSIPLPRGVSVSNLA